jgi:hypothetical protein
MGKRLSASFANAHTILEITARVHSRSPLTLDASEPIQYVAKSKMSFIALLLELYSVFAVVFGNNAEIVAVELLD